MARLRLRPNLSGRFLWGIIQRPPNSGLPRLGGDLTKPLYRTGQERTEEEVESVKRQIYDAYPAVLKEMGMIDGTPDNVLPKLKKLREVLSVRASSVSD